MSKCMTRHFILFQFFISYNAIGCTAIGSMQEGGWVGLGGVRSRRVCVCERGGGGALLYFTINILVRWYNSQLTIYNTIILDNRHFSQVIFCYYPH